MAERKIERMSADEFFDWQTRQERNYELVDGVPVLTPKAMTGATARHDAVTVNVLAALRNQLRGKPYRPRTDDIAIRNPNGNVRRPDILVECGKPDPRSMEIAEPRVLIEVLSPSTTRFDRFRKIEEYKAHPLVRAVLLIDSERPQIILWRRDEKAGWASSVVDDPDARIELPEIGANLPLMEIYEDVEFEAF